MTVMPENEQKTQTTGKNQNKRKGGRPKGRILDKPYNQHRMLRRIIVTGEERNCWKGIITKRSYESWKADPVNADWKDRVARAIKQHLNHKALADPALRALVVQQLVDRVHKGKLSNSELLRLIQYLPEHCEVVLRDN